MARSTELGYGVEIALVFRLSVERPGIVDREVAIFLRDSEKGDEAREATGLVGAARESEKIDFVAGFVAAAQKLISGL